MSFFPIIWLLIANFRIFHSFSFIPPQFFSLWQIVNGDSFHPPPGRANGNILQGLWTHQMGPTPSFAFLNHSPQSLCFTIPAIRIELYMCPDTIFISWSNRIYDSNKIILYTPLITLPLLLQFPLQFQLKDSKWQQFRIISFDENYNVKSIDTNRQTLAREFEGGLL